MTQTNKKILMIEPIYKDIYNWKFEDNEEEAYISFTYPVTFNPDCIEIHLSENKQSIIVSPPSKVPILCGKLFKPIIEAKGIYADSKYVISLTKKDREMWPFPIATFHEEVSIIDPKSAVFCYEMMMSSNAAADPQASQIALSLLQSAANVNYLPALLILGGILLDVQGREQNGFILLKQAADLYNDPQACFQVGLILVVGKVEAENGIGYIKRAASQDYKPAYFLLGQIYSPVGPFDYSNKDAEKALEYFNHITEEDKIPAVYRELANLYESGKGVTKDSEKAKMYREKAETMSKQIEEEQMKQQKEEMEKRKQLLQEQENQMTQEDQKVLQDMQNYAENDHLSTGQKFLVFGVSLGIAAAFSYLVYKKAKDLK